MAAGCIQSFRGTDDKTPPALVISTKAHRSGKISLLDGTQNIGAGDLSTLSINSP